MAERIVSPGVFTNEIDQSFLPGAIAQIGAAVVGPTVKGPAYTPIQITSIGDYQSYFGGFTDDSYVPVAVNEYLRAGNVITVTRLMYEDGYSLTDGALAIVAQSGSQKYVTHVLHPTVPVSATTYGLADSVLNTSTNGTFELKLSGSYTPQTIPGFTAFSYTKGASISASIVSADSNYITTIFGKSPKGQQYPVYVQYENPYTATLFPNLAAVSMSLEKISTYAFAQDYQAAATPWITSQKIGSVATNLFKLYALSHGNSTNYELKVGIANIKSSTEVTDPDGYTRFDVVVRRVDTTNITNPVTGPVTDSDLNTTNSQVITFTNCCLNPDSADYIVKKIGDRYQTIDDNNVISLYGDYANTNPYVRVEVDAAVTGKSVDKTLFPFGFRALSSPIPMISSSVNIPAATYKTDQTTGGSFSPFVYHGFDFTAAPNMNYLAPIPTTGNTTASNSDFYLGDVLQSANYNYPTAATAYSGSLTAAITAGTFATNVSLDTRKFIVPMQGGFDGARPNLPKFSGANITAANTFGFDCSSTSATGTKSYTKAFTLLSNTDYYDMNILLTPGVLDSLHSSVTSQARNLCRSRQDVFYVMDSNAKTDTIQNVVTQVRTIDDNYTATYWPWVSVNNPIGNGGLLFVPPSVVVGGVLSNNDRLAAQWYAPAGLNRGGIPAVGTAVNLSQTQRDTLYENRVNPIASFPNNTIVIWGQKTLQARPSALDRVNVRRLLIEVKKFIASSTRYLVFDQNTETTRQKFLNIVNPYLAGVKQNQGLSAFKVVMDSSNNTPDLVDRNILYGQLFLQPTRTAEFIILDFNIQPTGAVIPE
ncbi:Phage tail sheath C-terminal domain containing protein [uncultured Caudovirales phage]|uniref:Phage tail sheath C-terminal domain containing protein n=1 Tax=uncultured Caudovirales phage TaxID=2100421 RepID=A0A6J5NM37_9CAUD|nr:Phage tail sheath C-terminal domain containing protein [uncultured Caudovirales phage]